MESREWKWKMVKTAIDFIGYSLYTSLPLDSPPNAQTLAGAWTGLMYVDILRDTVQDRAKALLASKHVSNEYGKLYRIDTPVRLAMVWKKHGF